MITNNKDKEIYVDDNYLYLDINYARNSYKCRINKNIIIGCARSTHWIEKDLREDEVDILLTQNHGYSNEINIYCPKETADKLVDTIGDIVLIDNKSTKPKIVPTDTFTSYKLT